MTRGGGGVAAVKTLIPGQLYPARPQAQLPETEGGQRRSLTVIPPQALRAKRVLETADQCKRVALPVRTEPQPGAQLSLLQPCPPPSSV